MSLTRVSFGALASLLARYSLAADMRLARASPATQNPARRSLILNAHWNK